MGILDVLGRKNNRKRISENVEILTLLYDKIDKCFHQNFRLEKVGTDLSECVYKANASSFERIKHWQKEFKASLAVTLDLLSKHSESMWDNGDDKRIDRWNQQQIESLTEKNNQIKYILENAQIRY